MDETFVYSPEKIQETQNVVNSRNGRSLVGMLTQLINTSGISICMVGTPESAVFFEQAMQLARRSLGLTYGALPFDDFFCEMCRLLFSYRYVRHAVELTESMLSWLYEHTKGIVALLVALVHDAQEIAILSGSESLDLQSLEEAYQQRLTMLHGYLGYVCAAEDIFLNTWNLPNIEFLNDFEPEVCQHLEKNTSMGHIVMEHTMFPIYGRSVFLLKSRDRICKAAVSFRVVAASAFSFQDQAVEESLGHTGKGHQDITGCFEFTCLNYIISRRNGGYKNFSIDYLCYRIRFMKIGR